MKRFTVIFVCTGNLCRSPMAEGILKDIILDEVDSHHILLPIDVLSAGIYTVEGHPASRYAVEVAAKHGISLQFHRSRQLTAVVARNANLILVMEKMHTDFIHHTWPEIQNVHELKRYGRESDLPQENSEIMDPMGHGREVYRRVFNELKEEITRISRLLFPLIKEKYHVT